MAVGSGSWKAEGRKEKAASRRLGAFHVDYGAARKTERSEGNPAAMLGLHFQVGITRKTKRREGNPAAMQGLYFQAGVARKTKRSEGNPGVVTK